MTLPPLNNFTRYAYSITIIFISLFFQFPLFSANNIDDSSISTLEPPPDMVVSCKYWFNMRDLDDPNNGTFGRVVGSRNDRKKVSTYDIVCPGYCESDGITGYRPDLIQNGLACDYYNEKYIASHPDRKYHLVWGWDGFTKHQEPVNIEVLDFRTCGSGKIVRNFQLKEGGRWATVGSQTIWIVNCDYFFINRDDCRDNTDDIEWPLNCNQPNMLDGCGADTKPSNPRLGRPKVVNGGRDNCSMIAIDYKDDVITVVPNACFKILRTWRVVDWCQYHPTKNPYNGKWEFLQVIKVKDNFDPEIIWDSISVDPLDTIFTNGTCGSHATLKINAKDDCTPLNDLRYEYKIDLDNDGLGKYGQYDLFFGSLNTTGTTPTQHDNIYADDTSSVLNASGYYPIGTHKISWFVEDGCGNIVVRDTLFTIRDQKAPTPYCLTGIITVVMPSNGSISIWANDLDAGSFDNCTAQEDLKFYFNGDSSQTSYVVNCDTIANRGQGNSVLIEVEMWVEDESGNTDFCLTTIEVQDNQQICGITGTISLPFGHINKDSIQVRLMHNDSVISFSNYNNDFFFIDTTSAPDDAYIDVILKGNSRITYTIADLIILQKHILGKELFKSRRQYLAADFDGNNKISIKDLLFMYKVILGVIDFNSADKSDFNTGINFYPSKCPILLDTTIHPSKWPIIDDQICSELNWIKKNYYRQDHVNFSHYYMGDLSLQSGPEQVEWEISNYQQDEDGTFVSIEWTNSDIIEWSAFDLSIKSPYNGHFKVGDSNILSFQTEHDNGMHQIIGLNSALDPENDKVRLKYYFNKDVNTFDDGAEKLLNILSNAIMLDIHGTEYKITLSVRKNEFQIVNNIIIIPNPSYEQFSLVLDSNSEGWINLQLLSYTGQIIEDIDHLISHGKNNILLPFFSSLKTGVYYLRYQSSDGTILKKIVRL